MAFVYWIHLPEHTDMFSEGYVGVTINLKKRFNSHKHSANNKSIYPVHNAMRKHGNKIILETILIADEDYCYNIENKLRPEPNIGWNQCIGGSVLRSGFNLSEEVKDKISKTKKGVKATPEAIEANRQGQLKRTVHPNTGKFAWLNPRSNKEMWSNASSLREVWLENDSCHYEKFAKIVGLNRGEPRVLVEKFINGWNPLDDLDWLEFFKIEKEIKCQS